MPGWWEGLQAAALVVLAAQVWRLTRHVRRLEARGPSGRHRAPAGDVASFATLVSGYLELLTRAASSHASPSSPSGPSSDGADGGRPEGPADGRPELGHAVALLRQGLDPDEVARRTGLPVGEVRLLDRIARMAGWTARSDPASH
ncbi:MAG TPA: hypothetical protein VIK73_11020 [Limnochordales bacterium]